jgi:nitrogen fixation NifU-like protein
VNEDAWEDARPTKKKELARSLDDRAFERMVEELQNEISKREEEVYSEAVLSEAMHPINIGAIEDPDATGGFTGPCGDTMIIDIKVEEGTIKEIKFRTDGCGSTVACGSRLTKLVKDRTIEQAMELDNIKLEEDLGGLPEENKHCAVLAVTTLRETIGKLPAPLQKRAGGKD